MASHKKTHHKATTKSGKYVEKEMRKYKSGTKTSRGQKIKNRKQAIAIGLSEARRHGVHVGKKKTTQHHHRKAA